MKIRSLKYISFIWNNDRFRFSKSSSGVNKVAPLEIRLAIGT